MQYAKVILSDDETAKAFDLYIELTAWQNIIVSYLNTHILEDIDTVNKNPLLQELNNKSSMTISKFDDFCYSVVRKVIPKDSIIEHFDTYLNLNRIDVFYE